MMTFLIVALLIITMIIRLSGIKKAYRNDMAKASKSTKIVTNPARASTTKNRTSNSFPTRGVDVVQPKRRMSATALEDDRKGDWMAKQMEYERKALREMSEMFQLKMEHRNSCEAQMLKDFHSRGCDADGVDTASAK